MKNKVIVIEGIRCCLSLHRCSPTWDSIPAFSVSADALLAANNRNGGEARRFGAMFAGCATDGPNGNQLDWP